VKEERPTGSCVDMLRITFGSFFFFFVSGLTRIADVGYCDLISASEREKKKVIVKAGVRSRKTGWSQDKLMELRRKSQ
jgi:hypothetical protein